MTNPEKECNKKCILAVDDAAIILQRITDILGEYYDLVTVNSGDRALKYLERNRPDLILLDIRMTSKNGFETLQEIRAMKERADIPVIMLTGIENKQVVMESFKMGIRDYVLKPFKPNDLLERIRRVLESEKSVESKKPVESEKSVESEKPVESEKSEKSVESEESAEAVESEESAESV